MNTKSTRVLPLIAIWLWGIPWPYMDVLYSCPAFLPTKAIRHKLDSSRKWKRNFFKAYRWQGQGTSPQKQSSFLDIEEVPIQMDALDDEGHLVFKEDADSWNQNPIEFKERLTWNQNAFGKWPEGFEPKTAFSNFMCKESMWMWVYASKLKDHKLLLHYCEPASTISNPGVKANSSAEIRAPLTKPKNDSNPIFFDEVSRKVTAPFYEYHYEKFNHLMFNYIDLILSTEERIRVSQNSEQHIHVDVKNFFNLNFDAKDIESKVVKTRYEPYSLIAQLETFLKILFFKIDLELVLNVSFYEDSVHIPMILTMPADGPSNVNPGSGLMFTWENANPNFSIDFMEGMPVFSAKEVFNGYSNLGKYAEKFCAKSSYSNTCHFYFLAQYANYRFKVGFDIPTSKVKQGFFPMFIRDAFESKKDLKWISKSVTPKQGDKKKIGFYMETGVLKQGEHFWDLWLQMEKGNENVPRTKEIESCPTNLTVE